MSKWLYPGGGSGCEAMVCSQVYSAAFRASELLAMSHLGYAITDSFLFLSIYAFTPVPLERKKKMKQMRGLQF